MTVRVRGRGAKEEKTKAFQIFAPTREEYRRALSRAQSPPPAEIYAWCWEHKKVELMIGMREYVWNRLEGRPFVATNPAEADKGKSMLQDNRLQVAIKQLNIVRNASATAHQTRSLPGN